MNTKKQKKIKSVAVVGLGYVGLPLALLLLENGYDVIGLDIDRPKVDSINLRIAPFENTHIQKQLEKITLLATTDFKKISDVSTIIICVPTPVNADKSPNYLPLISACESVASNMVKGQLIIIESTVNPGVSEELILPILIKKTGLLPGKEFSLAHCPERINPGDSNWNVSNIPRVLGALDKKSMMLALSLYTSIISAPIKSMQTLKEAEACKIVENSFRNVNIALVNELAMSFEKLGIDVVNVIEGASTKPFAFMPHYPGCGIGGHCIPVDPHYLIDYAQRTTGFSHSLLKMACDTNEKMPLYTVELVKTGLTEVNQEIIGTKVCVLGLTYKADVADDRESPSYEIIRELQTLGLEVSIFDPYIPAKSSALTMSDAINDCAAIVIITNHTQFLDLSPSYLEGTSVRLIVDGRNCLNATKFGLSSILYKGIGR